MTAITFEKAVTWSTRSMPVSEIVANWVPGSQDQPWTWDDERADIEARICCCCDRPGHYQEQLEAKFAAEGPWWSQVAAPILGTDGRVWDGHHSIVAALKLGVSEIVVEVAS